MVVGVALGVLRTRAGGTPGIILNVSQGSWKTCPWGYPKTPTPKILRGTRGALTPGRGPNSRTVCRTARESPDARQGGLGRYPLQGKGSGVSIALTAPVTASRRGPAPAKLQGKSPGIREFLEGLLSEPPKRA